MFAASAAHSVVSGIALGIGTWLAAPDTRCRCECHLGGATSADEKLIALLQRQLDRCGPANLTAAPPIPPLGSEGFSLALIGCAFFVGVVLGALSTGLVLQCSWARAVSAPERPTSSPTFTSPRAATTPSTYRAGSRLPPALLG